MAQILNPHIYEVIAGNRLKVPDIPVYATESYGQCAEDLIVCALLVALAAREGLDLGHERYLEIGANHPVSCSTTYLLHRRLNMCGVLVEANPRLLDELRRFRPQDLVLHLAITPQGGGDATIHIAEEDELTSLDRRFVEDWPGWKVALRESLSVPALSLPELLEREFAGRAPLFLSIDIEGMDLDVLRTLDWTRWRPAIVQTEPSEHYHPGNADALTALLEGAGYIVVARTPVNLIALDAARSGRLDDNSASMITDLRTALQAETAATVRIRQDLAAAERARDAAVAELSALQSKTASLEHKLAETQDALVVAHADLHACEAQIARVAAAAVVARQQAEQRGREAAASGHEALFLCDKYRSMLKQATPERHDTSENTGYTARVQELESSLHELEAALWQAEAAARDSEARYQAINRSTFWRVTRPARSFCNRFPASARQVRAVLAPSARFARRLLLRG